MLPLRVHTIPLDGAAGAHVRFDLDGVRAILVQVLGADGLPATPGTPYELVIDDGSVMTTRQPTWEFGDIGGGPDGAPGARSLRLRFTAPEGPGTTLRVTLSSSSARVRA